MTFTFNGNHLALFEPPAPAPKGAVLIDINGWKFGLGPRSVRKLADLMRRQQSPENRQASARFGLDPDGYLVLDVCWADDPIQGVSMVVVEHGSPTDVRVTVPHGDIDKVSEAFARLAA